MKLSEEKKWQQHGPTLVCLTLSWMIQLMMWKAKESEVPNRKEHHQEAFKLLQQMLRLNDMFYFDSIVEYEILEGHIYYLRMILESGMQEFVKLPEEEVGDTENRLNGEVASMYAALASFHTSVKWDAEWWIQSFASMRYKAEAAPEDLDMIEKNLKQELSLVLEVDAEAFLRVEARQCIEKIRFFARHSPDQLCAAIKDCSVVAEKFLSWGSDYRMCDFFKDEIEEMSRAGHFSHVDHESKAFLSRLFMLGAI